MTLRKNNGSRNVVAMPPSLAWGTRRSPPHGRVRMEAMRLRSGWSEAGTPSTFSCKTGEPGFGGGVFCSGSPEVNVTLAPAVESPARLRLSTACRSRMFSSRWSRPAPPTGGGSAFQCPDSPLPTSPPTTCPVTVFSIPSCEYKVRIHHPEGLIEYRGGEVLRWKRGGPLNTDFEIAPFRKGRWRRYTTWPAFLPSRIMTCMSRPTGSFGHRERRFAL